VTRPPLAPATYPRQFGEHIVKNMWEKYPRATEFTARILDVKVKDLAIFFCKDQPMWVDIRCLVHLVDIGMTDCQMHYTDVQLVDRILNIYNVKISQRLRDRIDQWRNRTNNKEAGARGRLYEANAE
jgi:hypothetical protein